MPLSTRSPISTVRSVPLRSRPARLVRVAPGRAVLPSVSAMPLLQTLPSSGELLGGALFGAGLGALLGLALWVTLLVLFAQASAAIGGAFLVAFVVAGGFWGFQHAEHMAR